MKPSLISDDQLRRTVGESLNIYRGTIAVCSILMGFVFSALLQMLAGPGDLTHVHVWTVIFLVVALLSLLGALLSLQLTANQTIRYWGIFHPSSLARTLTVIFLPIGIACMLFAVVAMLWAKALHLLAYLTFVGSVVLIGLSVYISTFHKNEPYRRVVADDPPRLTNVHSTDPTQPGTETPTSGVGES